MIKNKFLILAILITLFGLALRLWRLGSVPVSLTWDEAAWGYNGYSLLKTGRDEYGQFLPFVLKSFGDYKPALYAYLVAISELFFGLNELAVRLPAALFGSLGIFLICLLIRELFSPFKGKEIVGLLASFVLATTPWHFHFSHSGWEASVLITFLLLGIWLFLKGKKENEKWYYLSAFVFGLSFYLYQGGKLLVPLIVFGLWLFFRKKIKQISRKSLIACLLILFIFALPIYSVLLTGEGGRLKVMSLFSYPRSQEEAISLAEQAGTTPQSWQYQLFHGEHHYYLRGFLGRYLNHFSGWFLFFEGDKTNHRHSVPNIGMLNYLAIFFLPLGAFYLIKKKLKNQGLIWYLLLISPLPASLTRDLVQAHRNLLMVIPLTILTAFGIYGFFQSFKKLSSLIKWGIVVIFLSVWLFSFSYYLDQFFIHGPIKSSEEWLYGYREAVNFVAEYQNEYNNVVFTRQYGQPYIYYLFYTAYPPQEYQVQAKLIKDPEGDVGFVSKLGKIEFRDIYWPGDRFIKNSLFVGTSEEIPLTDVQEGESRVLEEIDFLNGKTAFRIVETLDED